MRALYFTIVCIIVSAAYSFQLGTKAAIRRSIQMNILNMGNSFFTAELFASPAAKYNGELIDQSLKLVEKVPKPDNYVYGAVSDTAFPALFAGLIAIVGLAYLIPAFLSIGESAKAQQQGFEAEDKTTFNEFKARENRAKSTSQIPKKK